MGLVELCGAQVAVAHLTPVLNFENITREVMWHGPGLFSIKRRTA